MRRGRRVDQPTNEWLAELQVPLQRIASHASKKGFGLLRAEKKMGLVVGFKLRLARFCVDEVPAPRHLLRQARGGL